MSSIDQQFVEYIVKSLVGKPESVVVERRIDEKGVLLELTVDPDDLGRVIGKRGATAQSLRTLLRALGTKNDARYNLKIVDNGVGGGSNGSDSEDSDISSRASQTAADDNGTTTDAADTDARSAMAGGVAGGDRDDEFALDDDRADRSDDSRVSKTRRELEELDDLDV